MFKSVKLKSGTKKELLENAIHQLTQDVLNLKDTVSQLEAQLFKVKYPSGKIELKSDLRWSYFRHICFTYSDDSKIHKVKLASPSMSYSYYKVKVYNGKAFIGLRYVNEDDKENFKDCYYVVDVYKETSIEIEDKIRNLEYVPWVKPV